MARKKGATKDGGPDATPDVKEDAPDQEETIEEMTHPVFGRGPDMDAIVARRNVDFEKKTGVAPEEDPDITPVDDESDDGEPGDGEPSEDDDKPDIEKKIPGEASEDQAADQAAGTKPKTVKIVVDGQEMDVELDKIIDAGRRTLQKESKAEKTLQEVIELKKQLEGGLKQPGKKEPELDEQQRNYEQEVQQNYQNWISDLKKNIESARTEHIKALNYGEEDDVNEAAQKYEAAVEAYNDAKYGNYEAINKEQIINEAMLRTRYIDIQTRLAQPPESGGYSDIFGQPYLRAWAADEVNKLIADGSPDDWPTYQKACEGVRQSLGSKKPEGEGGEKKTTPTLKTRVVRKEKIDNLDTAAGRHEPAKEREESAAEVIDNMRKARIGQ